MVKTISFTRDGKMEKHQIQYVNFELDAVVPKLNGRTFLSKIEILDDMKMISTIPGRNLEPEQREREVCDHCKVNRRRNRYFWVERDGEQVELGSSCVKDFLGHADPEVVAKYFEIFSEDLTEIQYLYDDEDGYCGTFKFAGFALTTVVACAYDHISKYGFVSKKRAVEEGRDYYDTTAYSVESHCFDIVNGRASIDYESVRETVEAIIKSVTDKPVNTDLDFTVNSVFKSSSFVPYSKIAWVCAAVNTYIKDHSTKVDAVDYQYFGKPGDVYEGEGVVKSIKHYQSDFSYRPTIGQIVTIIVGKHVFVWMTTSDLPKQVVEGTTVKFRGKVKKHNEFNKVKQTMVSHVKFKL